MGKRVKQRMAGSGGQWALLVAAAALLSACNMTPDYERPQQDLPTTFRTPLPPPPPDLPRPTSQWWTSFGSDELDALVEEALANNHDLKAATHRIAQAEATSGGAGSALLPTIGVSAKRSMDSPDGGVGVTDTPLSGRSHRLQSVSMTASYEFDLWGKNRASEQSALAGAMANVHDREAIAITLVADLVNTYLQYIEGLDRERVIRQNVANMRAMQDAVRERVRLGESSELELAQQRNVLAQAEATIPPVVLQREHAFDKIAVLLGRAPGTLALRVSTLADLNVPQPAPGLPSDLLLRRPDVRKAEANLIAANANIGVARARMLPSFSLTGERGWGSQLIGTLLTAESIYYTMAASVAATIFDNGKGEADVAFSKAKYAELVEVYQQAILASLRDIDDALIAIRLNADLETAQQEVFQASNDAHKLSSEAFRIGLVDYLNVLETQRTRFQAEDARVQARFGRLAAAVSLFKALGGGMEDGPAKDQAEQIAPAAETGPPAGSAAEPRADVHG
jgi:outer membrane protein, multidrug efflux system